MLNPDEFDRANLTCALAVGSCTGLHIAANTDDPDLASRRNTALIEIKTVFLFRTGPVHK